MKEKGGRKIVQRPQCANGILVKCHWMMREGEAGKETETGIKIERSLEMKEAETALKKGNMFHHQMVIANIL